jgi:hypothetical protein
MNVATVRGEIVEARTRCMGYEGNKKLLGFKYCGLDGGLIPFNNV